MHFLETRRSDDTPVATTNQTHTNTYTRDEDEEARAHVERTAETQSAEI